MILRVCKFPEDGAQVPKHVGLILIMNRVLLCCVFHCILLSAFVGNNTDLFIHNSGRRVLLIFLR